MARSKKVRERSNLSYMQKLLKKSGVTARGAVKAELNLMLTHLLSRMTYNMGAIMKHYSKLDDTLKPNLVKSAFEAMLTGELRSIASDAAESKLMLYVNNKTKNGARAKNDTPVEA